MARKGDEQYVLKAAAEGFGLLEHIFPNRYPVPQGPLQFPPPQGHSRPEEAVLGHFEAAKKYGGIVVYNERMRNQVKFATR